MLTILSRIVRYCLLGFMALGGLATVGWATPATPPAPLATQTVSSTGVSAVGSQPDLLIRLPGDAAYAGEDVYQIEAEQTKSVTAQVRESVTFYLQLQNDGPASERLTVTGTAGGDGWAVRYFDTLTGAGEITSAITAAAGWTPAPAFAAGEAREVRVELTAERTVTPGTYRDVRVTAVSSQDATKTDVVTGRVLIRTPAGASTRSAAVVALSPMPGTYTGEVTVTLACVTDISYRLDNGPWLPYTAPIQLTSTTTITAKSSIISSGNPETSGTYTLQVASPTLTPEQGIYANSVDVALACATPGAAIRYTLNGTMPTSASALYSTPLRLTGTATVKAKAFKAGMTESALESGTYLVQVAPPTLTPAPGLFTTSVNVALACATPGAAIRYTLDGTPPTSTSTLYAVPLRFTTTTTVKAKAFKAGIIESEVVSGTYTAQVVSPTLTPAPGPYTAGVSVALTCATSGAAIRYTLDGTPPTSTSALYTAPFRLTATTTMKAKAFKTGMAESVETSGTYAVQVAPLTLLPAPGSYTASVDVILTSATPGVTIRYTLDGTTPTSASPLYATPLRLTATTATLLKAKAFKAGLVESAVASGAYTVQLTGEVVVDNTDPGLTLSGRWFPSTTAPGYFGMNYLYDDATQRGTTSARFTPTVPVAGTYAVYLRWRQSATLLASNVPVTIIAAGGTATRTVNQRVDGGAWVLLGTWPFAAGTTGSITLGTTGVDGTVIADAVRFEQLTSVATPTLLPAPGTYSPSVDVTLACATTGATMRYTLDGTAPTSASPLYTAPLRLTATTMVTAKAFKTGVMESAVASGTYTLQPPGSADLIVDNTDPGVTFTGRWFTSTMTPGYYGSNYCFDDASQRGTTSARYIPALPATGSYTVSLRWRQSATTLASNVPVTITAADGTATRTVNQRVDGGSWVVLGTWPFAAGTTGSVTLGTTGVDGSVIADAVRFVQLITVATPTFTPAPGTYTASVDVTLACPTPGAAIRYTLDGAAPTSTSPLYTAPLRLTATTPIKAMAFKSGMTESAMSSGTYTVQVATPTLTPAPGTYTTSVNVALACATSGAAIRYTLDGTAPTSTSALYTAPLRLTAPTTVKAKAFKAGMAESALVSGTYTVPVATPTLSPAPGTYTTSVDVTLACATPGAALRYTLNGTTPTSTSPLYTTPLRLTATSLTLLKVKAYKTGMPESAGVSGGYKVVLPGEVIVDNTDPGLTLTGDWAPSTQAPGYFGWNYLYDVETQRGTTSARFTPTLPAAGTYAVYLRWRQSDTVLAANVPVTITYAGGTATRAVNLQVGGGEWVLLDTGSFAAGATGSITLGPTPVPGAVIADAVRFVPATSVATPTLAPAPGTYTASVDVTLTCATSGAAIRYTLDGTAPTSASPLYTAPVRLIATTPVKAKAFKASMAESALASGTYTVQVAAPTLSPAPGSYTTSVDVTLACATPGAAIRYTLSGTTPTSTSTLYTAPLRLSATSLTLLKVKVFKAGMLESAEVSGSYRVLLPGEVVVDNTDPGVTLTGRWAPSTLAPGYFGWNYLYDDEDVRGLVSARFTPTVPAAGTYVVYLRWRQSDSTLAANVPVSITYAGGTAARAVNQQVGGGDWVLLGAWAFAAGSTGSVTLGPTPVPGAVIADAVRFVPAPLVATPTLAPTPGTYTARVDVTLTCATPGAAIRYTLDGTTPTSASPLYTAPLRRTATTTVTARAFKDGMTESAVTSGTYTVQVATPTMTPAAGTSTASVEVTLACTTPGAAIRYTLDGTTPTSTSPLYAAPLRLTATTTVKGKAFKAGLAESALASGTYTVQVATPTLSSGTFADSVDVTLACATAGASLRYTLNGTTPTSASTLYTAPVRLTTTTTVKARAFKSGMAESAVASGVYTIQGTSGLRTVTVDNTDPGVVLTGRWFPSRTAPGYYGDNYLYDDATQRGTTRASLTPTLPATGTYAVYLHWRQSAAFLASNVPVTITHAGGTTVRTVNQRVDGGNWVQVGTWTFTVGTAGNVTLGTTGVNGNVIVDAVRFVCLSPDVIVDNADPVGVAITGGWVASTGTPGYWGRNYLYDDLAHKGTTSVRFTPNLATAGAYAVYLRWRQSATTLAPDVPVDITHGGGTTRRVVNQQHHGGVWVPMGIFDFSAGTAGNLLVGTAKTHGYVIADAVRFLPVTATPDLVVDNTDPNVTFTGRWYTSASTPGFWGVNYHYDDPALKGTSSARFTPVLPATGTYAVFLRWRQSATSLAAAVPVEVVYDGGVTTLTVNQQANGGQWVPLGAFPFRAGTTGSIVLRTTGTTGYVIADAVRLVKVE
jgi:hypothetical protein